MTGRIEVRSSRGRGRGVFAVTSFERGDVIEESPVIAFADDRWWRWPDNTVLSDYSFQFGCGSSAIVLGYGSLYNHSYTPNVMHQERPRDRLMRFVAVRRIESGEELLINYAGVGGTASMKFEVI